MKLHIPILLSLLFVTTVFADDEKKRLAEIDAYWTEVSRSVKEGDFEAYSRTADPEAVLVTGIKKQSYPLSKALARWKIEFDDTKAGKRKSSVVFRFSHRYGDATTAHEAGIFLYSFQQGDDAMKHEYIHFEALLVKKGDGWKIVMEYQKAVATEEEWKALK